MARVRHKRKPVAEMNVVPYIDVMLVLLVIFMVTAPMLNQGVKVDLPKVSSEALPQDNNVQILTISIKADKTYYWNLGSEVDTDKQMDKAMTLPAMTDAVTKIIAAGRDQGKQTQVFIRGDKAVDYGAVMGPDATARAIRLGKLLLAQCLGHRSACAGVRLAVRQFCHDA